MQFLELNPYNAWMISRYIFPFLLDALADSPELVNSSPYEDGWMFKIKVSDTAELSALLDAAGYKNSIDE